ncbi:unnamed protein product [Caenorhabditis bovis]|uniref:Uncharacterized protein n=1 Tax=Caenorhabditis bovis TaxID=2654633 RepID=A0A8S1F1L6_9PELO|nr:unnamed protein product [Caenorhabditis bovis]
MYFASPLKGRLPPSHLFRKSAPSHTTLKCLGKSAISFRKWRNISKVHGFVSMPISSLLEAPPAGLRRTLSSFEQIRNELRNVFRSKHRRSIQEVAIVIGKSTIRPVLTYRIPLEICESDDSTNENCGDTCGELNDVERRRINRDLFLLSQNVDKQEKHCRERNNRMFIYILGSDGMVGEEMEEDDPVFEKAPIRHYTFAHQKCNCEKKWNPSTSGQRWLRITPFVVHGKE